MWRQLNTVVRNPIGIARLAGSRMTARYNMARTLRFLYRQGLLEYDPVTDTNICNVVGSRMHLHKNDMGISLDLGRRGIRESISTIVLQSLITPDMVCYDIGANIGYYVLLEAGVVSKGAGTVVAVEPEPENFRLLTLNIKANHYEGCVESHQCAISDRTGMARMIVGDTSNSHHLARDNHHNTKAIDVPCFTLPDFVEMRGNSRVDLIRMDIEGGEYLLFPTIYEMLETQVNLIFVEFHPDNYIRKHIEVLKTLHSLGFKAHNTIKFYFLHGRLEFTYCPNATMEDLWTSEFLLGNGAIHVILKR